MPITFSGLVSVIANAWKGANAVHSRLTNAALKSDFERYLAALEHRRVLYAAWEYENTHAVLASLAEILDRTRDFRAAHNKNPEIRRLFGSLITSMQKGSDTIRGCDMHTREGEFMAYKALLKIRSDLAKTLAVTCGLLAVHPHNFELEQFIMNSALVRPTA